MTISSVTNVPDWDNVYMILFNLSLSHLMREPIESRLEKPIYFDPFGQNNINHLVQVSLEFFL